MNVFGKHYRTVWLCEKDPTIVQIIDQRFLPFKFIIENLRTVDDVAVAIKDMHARGAGLIGALAGFGMYLAALQATESSDDDFIESVCAAGKKLKATRPTAVNLEWAVQRQLEAISSVRGYAARLDKAREVGGDHCR